MTFQIYGTHHLMPRTRECSSGGCQHARNVGAMQYSCLNQCMYLNAREGREMTRAPEYFRKLPVTIVAMQYNPGELSKADWLRYAPGANIGTLLTSSDPDGLASTDFKWFVIPTLEGDHDVTPGDYVITGVAGEQYPCKPDIFEKTYVHEDGSKI